MNSMLKHYLTFHEGILPAKQKNKEQQEQGKDIGVL